MLVEGVPPEGGKRAIELARNEAGTTNRARSSHGTSLHPDRARPHQGVASRHTPRAGVARGGRGERDPSAWAVAVDEARGPAAGGWANGERRNLLIQHVQSLRARARGHEDRRVVLGKTRWWSAVVMPVVL